MSELKYPLEFCKNTDDCDNCKFTDFGESNVCSFDTTSYKQGRADAIDEFVENMKIYYGTNIMKDIDKLAEQLKEQK